MVWNHSNLFITATTTWILKEEFSESSIISSIVGDIIEGYVFSDNHF